MYWSAELKAAHASQRSLINGRLTAPLAAEKHGTVQGYSYYMCRCAPCTLAHKERLRKSRQTRFARRVVVNGRLVSPDVTQHGTLSAYVNHGCRCVPCTEANAAHCARRRAKIATAPRDP